MNDYRKSRDVFNPAVSDEQIRRAEELLGGWSVGSFVEKRALGEDYRAGSLRSLDGDPTDGSAVLISRNPVAREERYVVLSRVPLPAMPRCEITVRRLGQLHSIAGIFEPSHAGRRAEDCQGDTRLMVSFFYPE
ncbi:MAG: hypothetical protein RQ741_12240 [Wenzhouxiangellaceae bacterium]|nr:hypothetical protein [Wenzhouxiangellaceae bacterium]